MEEVKEGFVGISAQYGDKECSRLINPMQMEINRLSEILLRKTYVEMVTDVGIIFRVNGHFCSFPEVGPCRLRRSFKNRDVSIDIVIPSVEWQGKTRTELSTYVIEQVELALHQVINRLIRDKVEVDKALLEDFATLKEQFLDFFHDQ